MGEAVERWRARAVDAIKRRALRRLHATPAGEALVLTLYLWGEEAAEVGPLSDLARSYPEPWLQAQVLRHLEDEARHAGWLRARLTALGRPPAGPPRVDAISSRKLRALRKLVAQAAPHFSAGDLVPLFAVAQTMEVMAARVLARHVEVLAAPQTRVAESGSTHAVLQDILADERKHATACEAVLQRLVKPEEQEPLRRLRERILAVERSFGVTGAIALWVAGVRLQLRADALHP